MFDLTPYVTQIKNGEVVAFPTETVYGLGANAWNPTAIQKIFDTKGRPTDNPLIVHISAKKQLSQFAQSIPEEASKLIDAFWPGPLTIVLSKKPEVLDLITAGLQTVGLRMPDHPLALSFIEQAGPLVAPSANTSGKPSPTKAVHVLNDFGANFPVIDGGPTKVGLESTVVDLTSNIVTILRPGKIGRKELEDVLQTEVQYSTDSKMLVPKSPGQKYSHYQPNAKVYYMEPTEFLNSTLYLLQKNPR
jgi:L-threonylcarbamoyladenylate synthase